MARKGGRVAVAGQGSQLVNLQIRITGVERDQDEFKRVRGQLNVALRDAMQRAGERTVLPVIKAGIPRKNPAVKGGLQTGVMASSIQIKRDRLDVVIKSTLPKDLDRALGWIDFGGKRARDTKVRVGPHVIVGSLEAKSAVIDDAVLDELERLFKGFEFTRG